MVERVRVVGSGPDLIYLTGELIAGSGKSGEGVDVSENKKGRAAVVQEPYEKAKDAKSGEGKGKLTPPSTKFGPDAENNLVAEAEPSDADKAAA